MRLFRSVVGNLFIIMGHMNCALLSLVDHKINLIL